MDCIGMNIANPAENLYSLAQIWNPPNSGVNLLITTVCAAVVTQTNTPLGTIAADLPMQNYALPLLNTGNTHSKNIGDNTAPKAQMNSGQLPAGVGGGVTGVRPLHEFWLPGNEKDQSYDFNPPITIPPGFGIAVRAAQPDMTAIASWQWSEVPA